MSKSSDELTAWVGRSETVKDQIGATPVKALNATLDHAPTPVEVGTPLPPLWHWLYFLPLHQQSEIGADGHAKRGGFLPPVPLPRRMWAGSQFEFRTPLRVGDAVERTSTPSTPASFTVGTSGIRAERLGPATASARSLPDLTCGNAVKRLGNMNCVCPPIVSLTAGAEPLYGAPSITTPALSLNSSAA